MVEVIKNFISKRQVNFIVLAINRDNTFASTKEILADMGVELIELDFISRGFTIKTRMGLGNAKF